MEKSQEKKYSNQSSIKIKFILVLILSNACMFLLTTTTTSQVSYEIPKNYSRIDYVKVKINAELMTEFSKKEPVKIISKNRSFIINNAYIISKVPSSTEVGMNFNNESSTSSYIVYLHKSHSHELLNNKQYKIYPQNFRILKRIKRKNHEIIF